MKHSKGFSLLEILVAFTIMAVSLSILLKIFSSGVNTAFVAEEYTSAVQIAESILAKTGVEEELVEGESSGIEADKYSWRVIVSSIENPAYFEDTAFENDDSAIDFLQVTVSVVWDDIGNQQRLVELNTIRLGSKE